MKKVSQILGTAICMLLPFVAVAQEPDSLTHRQDIIKEAVVGLTLVLTQQQCTFFKMELDITSR